MHQEKGKELNEEEKLIKNAQLFIIMRTKKSSEEKMEKIRKYLNEGANINAKDANDKGNTPLHVAVAKGELDIVKFLLNNKALTNVKNSEGHTPLCIAKKYNHQEIVTYLETYQESYSQSSDQAPSHELSCSEKSQLLIPHQKIFNDDTKSKCFYNKRSGTSGVSGQLYETKLLSLLLFRALNDKSIEEFYLGTNVDDIGSFDDIVFKYRDIRDNKTNVLFMQAKHRDNPSKRCVTVEEMRKWKGDFSLSEYFDSYLRIKHKFNKNSNDKIFEGEFENLNCNFVIYTSGKEDFSKKKSVEKNNLISSNEAGKTFKFEYKDDDIAKLMETALQSHMKILAESLCKFIWSERNCSNMMSDELIQTYHVFLAQNLIEVSTETSKDFRKGKFQSSFFSNDDDDDMLMKLRNAIFQEIVLRNPKRSKLTPEEIKDSVDDIVNCQSPEAISKVIGNVLIYKNNRLKFINEKVNQAMNGSSDAIKYVEVTQEIINKAVAIAGERILKEYTFNLPSTFGNLDFQVKNDRRLSHLVKKLIKMIQIARDSNILNDSTVIRIGKDFQNGDMQLNGGIGGLVGNLLILDEESNMLKFNTDGLLTGNSEKILKMLKDNDQISEDDLKTCRFVFHVKGFPRLSLRNEYDEEIVLDFLDKLYVYTDQARECEIDNLLKTEMGSIKQNTYFHIATEAVFLKFHNEIQKWWKNADKPYYITKNCNFLTQAKECIIDKPLLSILRFIYVNKVNKNGIAFNDNSIAAFGLDGFLHNSDDKYLIIISKNLVLSGMKLIQYFNCENVEKYVFIDLDYVLEISYYDTVISELAKTGGDILVIGCGRLSDTETLCEHLNKSICKNYKKIIIIAENNSCKIFKESVTGKYKYVEVEDNFNNLIHLSQDTQASILEECKINVQGEDVCLGTLINIELMHLIDEEILTMFINNEKVEVLNWTEDLKYQDIKEYYIDRKFHCKVKIHNSFEIYEHDFITMNYNKDTIDKYQNIEENRDVVIISDVDAPFKQLCEKYNSHNIHWLKKEGNDFVWQRSNGTLSKLLKYVVSGTSEKCSLRMLTDLNDKAIILAAESGMGKSVVLSKLSKETKKSYPFLYIARINLIEYSHLFSKWQDVKSKIDEAEAIKFLYRTIDLRAFQEKGKKIKEKEMEVIMNLVTINSSGEIELKNEAEPKIKGISLLEIKLFNSFYNTNKTLLLFDGFDEVSPDYKREVLDLLQVFKKSRIRCLWVTTRPYNIQSKLEDTLGTFAFTLLPFSESDQKLFLKQYWGKKLGIEELNGVHFNTFTDKMLKQFSDSISDQENTFCDTPILIKMIADVFQNDFKKFYNFEKDKPSNEREEIFHKRIDINVLYEDFFRIKCYDILYGEKALGMNKAAPHIKELITERYKIELKMHRKLAFYSFFLKDELKVLLSDKEIAKLPDIVKQVVEAKEKIGIVNYVNENNVPVFCHQSFLEYFVANYLWQKFKCFDFYNCEQNLIKYIIIGNLIKKHRIQICKFFVSEAQNDLHSNFIDKNHKLCTLFTELVGNIYPQSLFHDRECKLLLKVTELCLQQDEMSENDIFNDIQKLNNETKMALLCVCAEMGYVKIFHALKNSLSSECLLIHIKIHGWDRSPVWLAAENGHGEILQVLIKYFEFSSTWEDRFETVLIGSIFHSFAFGVLRSCLLHDIVNGKPYKSISRSGVHYPTYPLVLALKRNAPVDVIKLLIEKTDIDFIEKYDESIYMMTQDFLKCGAEVTESAVKRGISFSINLFLYDFVYHRISNYIQCAALPEYLRDNFSNLNCYDMEVSKFSDMIEMLLNYGIVYKSKASVLGTRALRYKELIYCVQQILHKIYELHIQRNMNPSHVMVKLIVNTFSKSNSTKHCKITIGSQQIFLHYKFSSAPYEKICVGNYILCNKLVNHIIWSLLCDSQVRSTENLVNRTLDVLYSHIESSKIEIEKFKITHKGRLQIKCNCDKHIDKYRTIHHFVGDLENEVCNMCITEDYEIKEALKEVTDEVKSCVKFINALIETKNIHKSEVTYIFKVLKENYELVRENVERINSKLEVEKIRGYREDKIYKAFKDMSSKIREYEVLINGVFKTINLSHYQWNNILQVLEEIRDTLKAFEKVINIDVFTESTYKLEVIEINIQLKDMIDKVKKYKIYINMNEVETTLEIDKEKISELLDECFGITELDKDLQDLMMKLYQWGGINLATDMLAILNTSKKKITEILHSLLDYIDHSTGFLDLLIKLDG